MIARIRRPYGWAKIYTLFLTAAFVFVLLDAFVIPKSYAMVEQTQPTAAAVSETQRTTAAGGSLLPAESSGSGGDSQDSMESPTGAASPEGTASQGSTDSTEVSSTPMITENSYMDDNIQITIETVEEYDTTFYVADIQITDTAYLKTALAQNAYGRNLKETTSAMAESNQAILAVNGDYYGFRDTGYVLRNGVLYRDSGSGDALIIDGDGNFSIVDQSTITAEVTASAWQIFAFGPALVEDGAIAVNASSEVSQAMGSNPRTAIGQIGVGHYIVIVSDGRTDDSEGLSLLQLAQEFEERGAVTAYNLDGGGSSTMVFNGELVNMPSGGRSGREREVSDIVYIGY